MRETSPEETSVLHGGDGNIGDVRLDVGMSPYATGGGGVTFERKTAVLFLAHLLVGDGANELGDGRCVVRVEFQQAPDHPVDDLVVFAKRTDELEPSLVLALAIRRSPKFVLSNEDTRRLVRGFVHEVIATPAEEPEHRLGLVVAGPQQHAKQLSDLARHAASQVDAPGFFRLIHTANRFSAALRTRLEQLERLVQCALHELGEAEVDTALVQNRAWQLLRRLAVFMPRLERPDDTDWSNVANSLIAVSRGSDLNGALRLRDRLFTLASEYAPAAARVDLTVLRRDAHATLDWTVRQHQQGWQALNHLHCQALASVRDKVTDGARCARLDRSAAAAKLIAKSADAAAVVVSGESGVGKSALALLGFVDAASADTTKVQALCLNLRQLPKLTLDFEARLGCPLSTLLRELSAPHRTLIVDGVDAVAEGHNDSFGYLLRAAKASDVRVIAVASVESKQVVRETLAEPFGADITEFRVAPLEDTEIDEIVETFPELDSLRSNPRSRELLRRLVVVDLLVRGHISSLPLSDADAMREVWSGLVRRGGRSDRGSPEAREWVLLKLADLVLSEADNLGTLDVVGRFDTTAIAGLRLDGLLRTSSDNPFMIGPEFAHDEVRRYAIARLLLSDRAPALKIMAAGAPRWSLAASRLACQGLLAEPDTATYPVCGRFASMQASFDGLVEAGHGARWGDVPGEALLTIANPDVVLRDAWPGLLADDSAGLRRLARLVNQRLRRDNGCVDVTAIEPIITLLLEGHAPWRSGKHVEHLLRDWLHGHVLAKTAACHPLRILLRERLIEVCTAADRRHADDQEVAAATGPIRTPDDVEGETPVLNNPSGLLQDAGGDDQNCRQRPAIAHEITDETVLELLALLGPDLGDDGEEILLRVAREAPSWLGPAVDNIFTGFALAGYRRGFLAQLTEAYYLDAKAHGTRPFFDGIRPHRGRSVSLIPQPPSYRGPFMPLFQLDFRIGVAVLNRLLNHATRVRVRTLDRLSQANRPPGFPAATPLHHELEIAGARRAYLGDEHVWRWYRGSGVGPDPCVSALQALERACDHWIQAGTPISTLVSILLDGCESLAMVGLVVGLAVRHLGDADHLLDPYLTEPLIWRQEFARVANERYGVGSGSEEIAAPERRNWSLREAAVAMVLGAHIDRAAELRQLGQALVANARREINLTWGGEPTEAQAGTVDAAKQELAQARAWASSLDRDSYQFREAPAGLIVQPTPSKDIVGALQHSTEDLESAQEAIRLEVRYYVEFQREREDAPSYEKLGDDIAVAQTLLENPPSLTAAAPWDVPALVAVAALEAHLLEGIDLPRDALRFAADTVLRIGEGAAWPLPHEFEETLFERGADRSAARAVPLLLLPGAGAIRTVVDEADGTTIFERATRAGVNLARGVANEVRLHLARGLDPLWDTPCAKHDSCQHEVGLQLATETMRNCVLGGRVSKDRRRSVIALEDPVAESLANAEGDSILSFRLDAAIRSLAPAAMADICISRPARALLLALLAAQRRSLLSRDQHDMDPRGSQALVSARALLTLAEDRDDTTLRAHLDACAGNAALLYRLLRALSAAAEETQSRAATARRVWPGVVGRVLELNASGHAPLGHTYFGDLALAALIPNAAPEASYLYREIQGSPILWWEPSSLRSEVEAWLAAAVGRPDCVDQLVSFLRALAPEDQVRMGLPWLARLVLADPTRTARHAWLIPNWLIEMRPAAVGAGLLAMWQEVVDALVVAGVQKLAPYSE